MGTDDMNELEPEEPTFEQASQEAPVSEAHEEHEPAPRPAYVREPRHHKSQPPVNDVQADETYDNQYSHESGYTLSTRNRMSRGAYRSARSQETKVRQELKYGQYLSVPKGSREIFGSRERQQRRTIATVAVVVAVIAIIALLVVLLLQ